MPVPKVHELDLLLDLLLPKDPTVGGLRRGLKRLTQFAVDYRYPGLHANARDVKAAIGRTERVRREIRARLGLRAKS